MVRGGNKKPSKLAQNKLIKTHMYDFFIKIRKS